MSRGTHLVGTIPAPGPREAMELAITELGSTLDMLPDGETGERLNWVQQVIEKMRQHPDIELVRQGDWSEYDKTPRFRVKRGHRLDPESIDLGYARFFRESFPIFEQLTAGRGPNGIPFQVGIPSDFDLALFTFGPRGIFRQRRPYTEATLREIREIREEATDRVVFQIEVPAELVFVARMPPPLQPLMARYMAGMVTNLAKGSPSGTRFGVHLCLGDMNHRALMAMRDTRPVVHLANAIARRWPDGRTLEFMHAPFAAAVEPPSTDDRWYQPLERLRLPQGTRFIAGFAHDGQEIDSQRQIRATIDRALGSPADVAASCGLGRRTTEEAVAVMRRTAELAAD
jgi:hypothetical protein